MKYNKEYWKHRLSNATKVGLLVAASCVAGQNKAEASASDKVKEEKFAKETTITSETGFLQSFEKRTRIDKETIGYEASFGQQQIGDKGEHLLSCKIVISRNGAKQMQSYNGLRLADGKIISLREADAEISKAYIRGSETVIEGKKAVQLIEPENISEIATAVYQKHLQKLGYSAEEAGKVAEGISKYFYGNDSETVRVEEHTQEYYVKRDNNLAKIGELKNFLESGKRTAKEGKTQVRCTKTSLSRIANMEGGR